MIGLVVGNDLDGQERLTQSVVAGDGPVVAENVADPRLGHAADKADIPGLQNARILIPIQKRLLDLRDLLLPIRRDIPYAVSILNSPGIHTDARDTPQLGIVVGEDDVEIGANSCVDRARFGKTVIGEGAKIDNLVQIAHNVEVGKHCLLVAMSAIAGSVKLGDFVTIGGQAGISGHIEIASGVQLAGQSGVHQRIKEPGAYLGVPAKPIKDAMRIWRGVAKLHETTREVKALRKELDELKGD